jgi:PIN domain nuclease of toxin-antitoxin system
VTLLIDAHALIWYVDQDHLLSRTAHAAITDPANEHLVVLTPRLSGLPQRGGN